MKIRAVIAVLALLSILFAGSVARAELSRVTFDARTHVYWDQNTTLKQTMHFFIEVFDTEFKNPPDVVTAMTIRAPDGTTFTLTPTANWSQIDKGYWAMYEASAFSGGTIPGGSYLLTVRAGGVTIKTVDVVNPVTFITPSEMTYPTEGATSVPEDALLEWTATSPAATTVRYGITIWNKDKNEPVYCMYAGVESVYTNRTQYTMPKGTLKPNTNYRIQIQARTNLQDTDARANSKWVNFTTGSW